MPPALSERRNTGASPAWNPSTISWRVGPSNAAVQEPACRCRGARGARSSRRPIATYWVKTRTDVALGGDHVEQLVEGVELARAPGERARAGARYCAGWLQICLSAGEQLEHQARGAAMPSAPRDLGHVSLHDRLVQRGLLGGEGHDPSVSVFGGRSGAMPGSVLRRRSRNGRTRRASRSVGLRVAVALDGDGDRRGGTRSSGPSRPGVVQSRIAHSSVRRFSTGVPVRAMRARRRDGPQRPGRARQRVLDVLGLVGHHQPPRRPRRAPRRRGGRCRRW